MGQARLNLWKKIKTEIETLKAFADVTGHSPIMWLSISLIRLVGWGIIVISSLIFNGFSSELLPLDDPDVDVELLFLLSFLATVLWAEYTWFSKSLYMPKVAVQTVHL